MIVCVCRKVSDHQIRQAAANGAYSLACLQFELGVATQCGRCADCASEVLGEACGPAARGAQPITLYRSPLPLHVPLPPQVQVQMA